MLKSLCSTSVSPIECNAVSSDASLSSNHPTSPLSQVCDISQEPIETFTSLCLADVVGHANSTLYCSDDLVCLSGEHTHSVKSTGLANVAGLPWKRVHSPHWLAQLSFLPHNLTPPPIFVFVCPAS